MTHTSFNNVLLGDKVELFDQLCCINNNTPLIISEIFEEIRNYDSSMFSFWEEAGLQSKIITYLLHYTIPFYELLESEGKNNVGLLTTQLLSCLAWRTFDNCIDGHESNKVAHLNSIQTCMHLIDYAQFKNLNSTISQVKGHYNVMLEQAIQEAINPIELDHIWKRCSIFLYAPETFATLNETNITTYKNFINYTGLAHDLTDLVSDISGGAISLPIFWMREANEYNWINVKVMKSVYQKARDSVKHVEDYFRQNDIEHKFPMLNHLLKQSSSILNS
ncbi:hypothetical protein [Mucilaginibacter gotjawali]|uniref:Uncharacterized protein n=2 Tax=Mucilaginibacter gotjawali TaxID=1550579 RepID=A0A839SK72_9SPHI|nr:hypothetical protein [Mucilaginibacter gotjawali]MBB3058741.1 hypothetical protein [Mucilaginibacter gotjawali]BAU55654.1 hypothetical protein MgSA37_03845 [Mucilaginibacter gotjawali]